MAENKSNMKGRVTVYSVPGCPHCTQAKAALKKLGLPVCEVDINKHRELQTKVKRLAGCSSVPQIFFNNVYVGNNEDLQNLVSPTCHFFSAIYFYVVCCIKILNFEIFFLISYPVYTGIYIYTLR